MQILAGILLTSGIVLCFASPVQDDLQFRIKMVFWGIVIYTIGYGILWVDHLICKHSDICEEEEEI